MTAEEIIVFLEDELADAYERHREADGENAKETLAYLIKAHTLEQILNEITK